MSKLPFVTKEQIEEMKQLPECMNYAAKQYKTMEERAEQYAKCIAWGN